MEKIIIVGEKERLDRIDVIKNIITSNTMDILIVDPKSPDYEEIIKKAGDCLLYTLDDSQPEGYRKERILEYKNIPYILNGIDSNILSNNTPWYDRFLKKGKKGKHGPSKPNSKKKGNKRK